MDIKTFIKNKENLKNVFKDIDHYKSLNSSYILKSRIIFACSIFFPLVFYRPELIFEAVVLTISLSFLIGSLFFDLQSQSNKFLKLITKNGYSGWVFPTLKRDLLCKYQDCLEDFDEYLLSNEIFQYYSFFTNLIKKSKVEDLVEHHNELIKFIQEEVEEDSTRNVIFNTLQSKIESDIDKQEKEKIKKIKKVVNDYKEIKGLKVETSKSLIKQI